MKWLFGVACFAMVVFGDPPGDHQRPAHSTQKSSACDILRQTINAYCNNADSKEELNLASLGERAAKAQCDLTDQPLGKMLALYAPRNVELLRRTTDESHQILELLAEIHFSVVTEQFLKEKEFFQTRIDELQRTMTVRPLRHFLSQLKELLGGHRNTATEVSLIVAFF